MRMFDVNCSCYKQYTFDIIETDISMYLLLFMLLSQLIYFISTSNGSHYCEHQTHTHIWKWNIPIELEFFVLEIKEKNLNPNLSHLSAPIEWIITWIGNKAKNYCFYNIVAITSIIKCATSSNQVKLYKYMTVNTFIFVAGTIA